MSALLALVLVGVGARWAEGRLGSRRTAAVLVVGQVAAVLVTIALVAALAATGWAWAVALAGALAAGISPGVLAVVAVASATLAAPWRLRLALVGLGVVGLLFLGHLAPPRSRCTTTCSEPPAAPDRSVGPAHLAKGTFRRSS